LEAQCHKRKHTEVVRRCGAPPTRARGHRHERSGRRHRRHESRRQRHADAKQWPPLHHPEPRDQRDVSADQAIRRLRPQLAKVEGAALFLQAAQDINIGGRPTRTQYQYTLQDANLDELSQWSSKFFGKMKTLPELRDVATDQQTGGAALTLTIDRDQAARFGIQPQLIDNTLYDAFG
jgi:multidrug efflux pump subunit AcrB